MEANFSTLIDLSWIFSFFDFWYSFFVFSKCISGMNLYPANKSLFVISFILYLQNEIGATKGIWLKSDFKLLSYFLSYYIPKLLDNPLVSCFLMNLDFLLSHTAHFHKSICFHLFLFATLGFLLSFFLQERCDNTVL